MQLESLHFKEICRRLINSDHEQTAIHPRYFEINDLLTGPELQSLTTLPYEVLFTASLDKKVILSTGTPSRARHKDDLQTRNRIYLELSLHTHPQEEGLVADAPSLSDIALSEKINSMRKEPRVEYLAHSRGMFIYQIPSPCVLQRELFYAQRGVALDEAESLRNPKLRFVKELPRTERVRLVRQFVESMGLILEEAAWDDIAGVDTILARLNRQIHDILNS